MRSLKSICQILLKMRATLYFLTQDTFEITHGVKVIYFSSQIINWIFFHFHVCITRCTFLPADGTFNLTKYTFYRHTNITITMTPTHQKLTLFAQRVHSKRLWTPHLPLKVMKSALLSHQTIGYARSMRWCYRHRRHHHRCLVKRHTSRNDNIQKFLQMPKRA